MTTLVEPEWDQQTRDLVVAHAQVPKCPVCGGDPEVCQDSQRAYDWTGDPVRCWRTTAMHEAMDRIDSKANPHPQALSWRMSLPDPAAPDVADLAGLVDAEVDAELAAVRLPGAGLTAPDSKPIDTTSMEG